MAKWKFMSVEQQLKDVLGAKTLEDVTVTWLAESLFGLARIRTSFYAFYSFLGLLKRAIIKLRISYMGETIKANPELAGVYLMELDDIDHELGLIRTMVIAARDGAAIGDEKQT